MARVELLAAAESEPLVSSATGCSLATPERGHHRLAWHPRERVVLALPTQTLIASGSCGLLHSK